MMGSESAEFADLNKILQDGICKLLKDVRKSKFLSPPYGRSLQPNPLISEVEFLRTCTTEADLLEDNEKPVFEYKYGFNPLRKLADFLVWSHPDSFKAREEARSQAFQKLQYRAQVSKNIISTATSLAGIAKELRSGILWGPLIGCATATSALCVCRPVQHGTVVVQLVPADQTLRAVDTMSIYTQETTTTTEDGQSGSLSSPSPVRILLTGLTPNTRYILRCALRDVDCPDSFEPVTSAVTARAATQESFEDSSGHVSGMKPTMTSGSSTSTRNRMKSSSSKPQDDAFIEKPPLTYAFLGLNDYSGVATVTEFRTLPDSNGFREGTANTNISRPGTAAAEAVGVGSLEDAPAPLVAVVAVGVDCLSQTNNDIRTTLDMAEVLSLCGLSSPAPAIASDTVLNQTTTDPTDINQAVAFPVITALLGDVFTYEAATKHTTIPTADGLYDQQLWQMHRKACSAWRSLTRGAVVPNDKHDATDSAIMSTSSADTADSNTDPNLAVEGEGASFSKDTHNTAVKDADRKIAQVRENLGLMRRSLLLCAWNDRSTNSDNLLAEEEAVYAKYSSAIEAGNGPQKSPHRRRINANSSRHPGGASDALIRPQITPSLAAFSESFPVQLQDQSTRQVYNKVDLCAGVEAFVLDTRCSFLGEAQAKWVRKGIENSSAAWKIVFCGVPCAVEVLSTQPERPSTSTAIATKEVSVLIPSAISAVPRDERLRRVGTLPALVAALNAHFDAQEEQRKREDRDRDGNQDVGDGLSLDEEMTARTIDDTARLLYETARFESTVSLEVSLDGGKRPSLEDGVEGVDCLPNTGLFKDLFSAEVGFVVRSGVVLVTTGTASPFLAALCPSGKRDAYCVEIGVGGPCSSSSDNFVSNITPHLNSTFLYGEEHISSPEGGPGSAGTVCVLKILPNGGDPDLPPVISVQVVGKVSQEASAPGVLFETVIRTVV